MILFEDTHLAIINKPAGLLSQGDISGEENLVDILRKHFGRNYVGLVHRLDRNTSGLMIVAKRSKSADRLTQSLQKGLLKRGYLAFLSGSLSQKLKWTHHLVKDEKTNTVRCYQEARPQSKVAIMQVEALSQHRHGTLCRIELETGRSHQIRVQSAFEGHALLGDTKYAPPEIAQKAHRPALHSAFLSVPHPMTQENLSFEIPWPDDLKSLLT
jgi:23S rRNA pseudouridine1911/1915/1917 synthase